MRRQIGGLRSNLSLGRASAQGDERGEIKVLTIGYVVLALLLATVLMAISAVYLEHKKLLSLADGASSAAADTFSLSDIAQGPGKGNEISLNPERIRTGAADFLRRAPAADGINALVLESAQQSPDGRSAVVTLSATARPPIVGFLLPNGVKITATSSARATLIR